VTNPRAAIRTAARGPLRLLSALPSRSKFRVAEADGRLACLIQVWDTAGTMPTVERRPRGERAGCKQDTLAALRAAGRPLTRKLIVKALRDAKTGHGTGTVAKALADLTKAGDLLNPRDRRGYRLSEWARRRATPSLFD
jgi:hypothetical protein